MKLSSIIFLSFIFTNLLSSGKVLGEWAFYISFFGPSMVAVFVLSIFLHRETVTWIECAMLVLSSVFGIYLGLLFKVSLSVGIPITTLLFSIESLGERITEELFAINYYFFPSQLVVFVILLSFYKLIRGK